MNLFKKIQKEKELYNRELELYKQEQFVLIEKSVEEYRQLKNKEIHDLAIRCEEDTKNYEHEFHSTRERLGIELAKLESKKENLEAAIKNAEKIIEHKDQEITRVNIIIMEIIKNLPKTMSQKIS